MCNNWQNSFLLEILNREIEWEKQSRRTEFQVFWSGKAVYCKLELVFNSRCWQKTGRKLLECGTIGCAGSKFKLFFQMKKGFEHSCSICNNEEETIFRLIPKKSEITQSILFGFFKHVNYSEKNRIKSFIDQQYMLKALYSKLNPFTASLPFSLLSSTPCPNA